MSNTDLDGVMQAILELEAKIGERQKAEREEFDRMRHLCNDANEERCLARQIASRYDTQPMQAQLRSMIMAVGRFHDATRRFAPIITTTDDGMPLPT